MLESIWFVTNGFFFLALVYAVSAINGLYVALGSPTLPGWTANGGDPYGERCQGVVCIDSNIDSM